MPYGEVLDEEKELQLGAEMYTIHTCKAEYVNRIWKGKALPDVNSRYEKISLVFRPLGICRRA